MGRAFLILAIWVLAICPGLFSVRAETLPPKPSAYFNDYAKVIHPTVAAQLDRKLRDFEAQTSNQVVVAIFPKMETDSTVQDFTHRIAESWQVGQQDRDNGVVLFVFIEDRKMYLQVGYGLEGALPDILAKQIIDDEIAPAFKAGHYDAGMQAGVEAILRATRGEYEGTGGREAAQKGSVGCLILSLLVIIWLGRQFRRAKGYAYGSEGRRRFWDAWPTVFSGSGDSGSDWSSSDSSWGGGDDFSGGGGSFGGGGAGGDW